MGLKGWLREKLHQEEKQNNNNNNKKGPFVVVRIVVSASQHDFTSVELKLLFFIPPRG